MNKNSFKGTREAFAYAITEIAEDLKYHVISADSVKAARITEFVEKFPNSFTEVGIAEQCAVDVAGGMSEVGVVPFVVTYAGFITMRACEQLRTFVAYPKMNVKFVGLNAGLIGGEREGVTHQFYEDVAIVRSIPNIDIVCPCDALQTYYATKAIAKTQNSTYMRIGSGKEVDIPELEGMEFELGKIRIIKDYGTDAVVFAHGFVMREAIDAVEELHEKGFNCKLVEVHTLKPLDTDEIVKLMQECDKCLTVEDHNVIGGLGSIICEVACEYIPKKVIRLGLKDTFGESGTPVELIKKYQINKEAIVKNLLD